MNWAAFIAAVTALLMSLAILTSNPEPIMKLSGFILVATTLICTALFGIGRRKKE